MELFVIAAVVAGVFVSGILSEIVALPLGDVFIAQSYNNKFWALDSQNNNGEELLDLVNKMLPQVEVLQELCSVPFPL